MCKFGMIQLLHLPFLLCICVCTYVLCKNSSLANIKSCSTEVESIQNNSEHYWGIVEPQRDNWYIFYIQKVIFIDVILMLLMSVSDPMTEFSLASAMCC